LLNAGLLYLRYPTRVEDLRYISFPPQLQAINSKTSKVQFSMASEPLVGTFLRTLAASKPGGNFLELGTGTGIATAWLLDGMDSGSRLTSVDNDSSVQQVAKESLGEDPRLTFVTSDGLTFLANQSPESYDLVFADAVARQI
jgi:predicted O-methyltransferase YrrM